MPKSQIVQALANIYPEWSDIRSDEQSIGFGFLNTIASQIEDLRKQLSIVTQNYNISTANLNDIDIVYKYPLQKSYEFTQTNDDEANPLFSPPTVIGTKNSVNYTVVLSTNNDIESFWYNSIPNRIAVSQVSITNTFVDNNSNTVYSGVAKFNVSSSPFNTTVILDQPYSKLWIQITGGNQYVQISPTGELIRGTIIITGLNRQGVIETETMIFLHDDILQTRNEWKEVYKIEAYNILQNTATVQAFIHRFGRTGSPQILPPKDSFNLTSDPESDEETDIFWDLSTSTLGSSVINYKTWALPKFSDRISGFVDIITQHGYELLNTSGAVITTAIDLINEPFKDNIWIVDNTKLYLFKNTINIANTKSLVDKQVDAMSIISPSSYHIVAGDNITIDYVWRRQVSDLIKYQIDVVFPNGTKYSIVNGSVLSYDPTYWAFTTPTSKTIKTRDILNLTARGDYVFTLTCVYKNAVTEKDQRIVSVESKTAITQFDISAIIAGATLKGIDFDSEQNMWILISVASVISKIKVVFSSDIMMIDYQKKILYLKENYDSIRIS